jgi:hypothetical protein
MHADSIASVQVDVPDIFSKNGTGESEHYYFTTGHFFAGLSPFIKIH